jgi:hypothetical protein
MEVPREKYNIRCKIQQVVGGRQGKEKDKEIRGGRQGGTTVRGTGA